MKNIDKLFKVLLVSTSLFGCQTEQVITELELKKGVIEYQPEATLKNNPKKVYMHYMPWFEAKGEYSDSWGSHWTMENKNPDTIGGNGNREIASHVYPLIGPYDSRDSDVIKYHLLLMKYAGIDGLLLNWYGTEGMNQDIDSLLQNSNAIIDGVEDLGMEFSVVMEDRFADEEDPFDDIKANILYLSQNYYNKSSYVKVDGKPLTLIFGPHESGDQEWAEALSVSPEEEYFIPLMNNSKISQVANGDFAWPMSGNVSDIEEYYKSVNTNDLTIAGAFPGFKDYYVEGGIGEVIVGGWEIPLGADQMKNTLDLVSQYDGSLDMLQLITWNDFGEGTTIEPTVEFRFSFLEEIQKFTGVDYSLEELEMVYQWYNLKKSERYNLERGYRTTIDQVYYDLRSNRVEDAKERLSGITD